MRRINADCINAGILLAVSLITSGCTTNRYQVDDHSYHHNDVAPTNTTVVHHHYPKPPETPKPTVQQQDQEYLQFQQQSAPANTYTPVRYPPVPRDGSLYYPTAYTYRHSTPGYSTNSQAYRASVRY